MVYINKFAAGPAADADGEAPKPKKVVYGKKPKKATPEEEAKKAEEAAKKAEEEAAKKKAEEEAAAAAAAAAAAEQKKEESDGGNWDDDDDDDWDAKVEEDIIAKLPPKVMKHQITTEGHNYSSSHAADVSENRVRLKR